MSIAVCKKCGYQVDTDFHAEQITDEGLCHACCDEEPDVLIGWDELTLASKQGDASDASK